MAGPAPYASGPAQARARALHRKRKVVTRSARISELPVARSPDATPATSGNVDRLTLRDYVREVEIGAFREEHGITQTLKFDAVVEVADPSSPLADDVDNILSYDTLVGAIDGALADERLNLLETLAEKIAERILSEPAAQKVKLSIQKLDRGPFALGVEIERLRRAPASDPVRTSTQRDVRIVHVSNAALADARLCQWLDRLAAHDTPTILTVGPPDAFAPPINAPATRRQIELLAVEQNAWTLAERDPRIQVVASRTELLHSLAAGLMSVWAPSKIVNDTFVAVETAPASGLPLTRWFATFMSAAEVLELGKDVAEPPLEKGYG